MQTPIPATDAPNPLVHLELSRRQTPVGPRVQLSEQPLVSELALEVDADEALLIALGELLLIDRPLRVQAIAHLDDLTLLWLDNRHWLLLPSQDDNRSAAQRLSSRLAPSAIRENERGLSLTGAWPGDQPDSFQLWQSHAGALPASGDEGHPVLVPAGDDSYQLLIRRAGAELLKSWLHPRN